ncbi:hypothetical protein L2719_06975 [Shewanella schlegeliana]|uniref:Uncharacterized protein n=1 Tax=Shewanella schlegeliana TaxID=190308 RepID=A0ABS1SYB3_9GAMM|nr:hypothetical protein [Shewanella schlegeliana]MBL4913330.1 hypothetical protein [Shewanella schlegeliana]MCL1109285.1 hypothetical protein [Shewanella schlegeliana]GIU24731.1 hypothetical protein TUM4433_08720 [Shewanella schlegeliana]
MDKLERATKLMMLVVGCVGLLVIYFGFFYLLFTGRSTAATPWYILLSPWVCIFFGLSQKKQLAVIRWFVSKWSRK